MTPAEKIHSNIKNSQQKKIENAQRNKKTHYESKILQQNKKLTTKEKSQNNIKNSQQNKKRIAK